MFLSGDCFLPFGELSFVATGGGLGLRFSF